jgi:hypothetical protein
MTPRVGVTPDLHRFANTLYFIITANIGQDTGLPLHVPPEMNVPKMHALGVLSVALVHVTARAPATTPQATHVPFST